MNGVDPLRAAKAFGLLFIIPVPLFFALIGLATAVFAVHGSLSAAGGFPLWITLPLLFVGPVMLFVGGGVVSAPFFLLAAGVFYAGSRVLIHLRASLFFILALGLISGFVVGVAAHFISAGNRDPWAVPLIGAIDGLLVSGALLVCKKCFSGTTAARFGVGGCIGFRAGRDG